VIAIATIYLVGFWWGIHTPRSSSPSNLWRGMTVTSSISHRKAISGGVSPGGRGNAMLVTRDRGVKCSILKVWSELTRTRHVALTVCKLASQGPSTFWPLMRLHHHSSLPPCLSSSLRERLMSTFIQNWPLHAALLLTLNFSVTWFNLVSQVVPEPYLVSASKRSAGEIVLTSNQDEFFHVPQAQRYCNGDYTWDPKITTPPGL
jgi:hypothetical protein